VGLDQAALARLAAMGHKIEFGSVAEAERLKADVEQLHYQLSRSDYQPEAQQQRVTIRMTQPANDARLDALERQMTQIAGQVAGIAGAVETSSRATMQALEAQAMLSGRLADAMGQLTQRIEAMEARMMVVQAQEYREMLPVQGTIFQPVCK
jgi:hypothetical protein